jgi:UDP-N-acetylmuramyl pentapeptide phosphotransferase/UDP-N-acetylglucosamine-1-phosphate transferase
VSGATHDWLLAAAVAGGTGLSVFFLLKPLIGWLRRRAIMDIPNNRSSHVDITPRGGGIAVSGGILIGLLAWSVLRDGSALLLAPGMVMLAIVSWLDDQRGGLPAGLRLGAQLAAVGFVFVLFPAGFLSVTRGLIPYGLEIVLLLLAWVWFVNLFNFMDGINGIAGVEMLTLGLGAALIAVVQQGLPHGAGLIVAAAALGFLPWNWGKAKVFLGDVGSVPAGYLLGGLLLFLALDGNWAAALILPMYYWVDATYTLLRRLLRGEQVWQAHRSHFYQQGARKLGSHAAAAGRIAILNLLLILLALVSTYSWQAAIGSVLLALVTVAALCKHFAEPG